MDLGLQEKKKKWTLGGGNLEELHFAKSAGTMTKKTNRTKKT